MAIIKGQLDGNVWHGHTPTIKVTGEYTVTDNKISVTSIKESRVHSDIVYPFPSWLYLCYSKTKFNYNKNYVLSSVDNAAQLIQFSSANDDFSPDPNPEKHPVEHNFAHYGYYCLAMKCGYTGGCNVGYEGYVLVSDIFERKDPSIKFSIIKDKVLVGQYLDVKINSIKGTWKLVDKRIPEGTSNSQKNNYKTIKTLGSYSKVQTISKYSQAGTKYGMYLVEASNGKKTVIQTVKVKLLPPNKNSTFTIQNNKVVKESNPPTKPKGAVLKSSVEGDHYLVWYEHNKGEYYPSDKLIVKKDGSGGGTKPPVPDPPSPGGDSSSFGPPELIVSHLHDSSHDPSPITVDETFSVTYSSDSAPKESDVNKGSYDGFEYFNFTFHVEYGGVSKTGGSVTYDALPGDVDITAYFNVRYQLYVVVPDYDDEGNVTGSHREYSSHYDIDSPSSSMTITGYCCPRDMLSSASDPYQITTDEEMSQSYVPIITTSNDYRNRVRLFTELWKKNNTVKVLSSTTTIHLDFETNDFAPRLDLGRFNYYKLEFVELPSQTSSGRDILIHEGSRSSDSFAISDYLSLSDDPTQFNSNELKRGERYQIRISCYCYYDGKVWRGNDTSTEQVGQTNIFVYGGDDGFILGGEPEPAELIYPCTEDVDKVITDKGSAKSEISYSRIVTYSNKPSLVFKAYNPDYIEDSSRLSGIKVKVDDHEYWASVKYLGDITKNTTDLITPYFTSPHDELLDPDSYYKTIVVNQGYTLNFESSSVSTDSKYENSKYPEFKYHLGVVSGYCPTWSYEDSQDNFSDQWKPYEFNYLVKKNGLLLTKGTDYEVHMFSEQIEDNLSEGSLHKTRWLVFDFKEISPQDVISITRIIYNHSLTRRNSKGEFYLTSKNGGLVEFQLPDLTEGVHRIEIVTYNDLESQRSGSESLLKDLGLETLRKVSFTYEYVDLRKYSPNKGSLVIADKTQNNIESNEFDVMSLINPLKNCLLSYRYLVGAFDDQYDNNFNTTLHDLFSGQGNYSNIDFYRNEILEDLTSNGWERNYASTWMWTAVTEKDSKGHNYTKCTTYHTSNCTERLYKIIDVVPGVKYQLDFDFYTNASDYLWRRWGGHSAMISPITELSHIQAYQSSVKTYVSIDLPNTPNGPDTPEFVSYPKTGKAIFTPETNQVILHFDFGNLREGTSNIATMYFRNIKITPADPGVYIKSGESEGTSYNDQKHKLMTSWIRSLEYCQRVKHFWTRYLDCDLKIEGSAKVSSFNQNLYRSRTGSHYSQIKFVHNEEEILRILEGKEVPSGDKLKHLCLVEVDAQSHFNKLIFDIREFGIFISDSSTEYSVTITTSPYCIGLEDFSEEFSDYHLLGQTSSSSPTYVLNTRELGEYQISSVLYPYEDTSRYIYEYFIFKNRTVGVLFRVNLYGRLNNFNEFKFDKQTVLKEWSPKITPSDFKVKFDLSQEGFEVSQDFTVPSGVYGQWEADRIGILFDPENLLSGQESWFDAWWKSESVNPLYVNDGTGKGVTTEGYVTGGDYNDIFVLKINGVDVRNFDSYYDFIYKLLFEAEEVKYCRKNDFTNVIRQKKISGVSLNSYYHDRMKLLDQKFIPLGDLNSERSVPIISTDSSEHFKVKGVDNRYYGNIFNNIIYGLGQVM